MLSVWIGKVLLVILQLKGGGSALPGLIAEKLDPEFLSRHQHDFKKVILVAGTNGKTTTTKMMRHILQDGGFDVITNAAGSNMPRGIISSFLSAMSWRGSLEADIALLEVDEGFIEKVAKSLKPHSVVVLNLLRDQLDRYGELDRTAGLIGDSLLHSKHAVLNADDPRVAGLSSQAKKVIWYGANRHIRDKVPHDDALHLKSETFSGHDHELSVELVSVEARKSGQLVGFRVEGEAYEVDMQIPGVFNAYNATAALATTLDFDISISSALDSLAAVLPAFGRSEQLMIDDKPFLLLLVKNPSGFNQIVHTYLTDSEPSNVLVGINDNYADGRDVSWLWDVDIESLSSTPHSYSTTGNRGFDMALRLQYADIESDTNSSISDALELAVSMATPEKQTYLVMTYTAMLEVRKQLSRYVDLDKIEV